MQQSYVSSRVEHKHMVSTIRAFNHCIMLHLFPEVHMLNTVYKVFD